MEKNKDFFFFYDLMLGGETSFDTTKSKQTEN